MKTNDAAPRALRVLCVAACFAAPNAGAQGSLNPPGPPAPTMKSLLEIWDKAAALEAQNQVLQQRITSLQQVCNQQNSILGVLLEKSGVTLPWKLCFVDTVSGPFANSSLAYTPDGRPALSYYDQVQADLKYAEFDGSTWQCVIVDSAGAVGGFSSLAMAPGGRPIIAYFDQTNGDLKYAAFNGTTWDITVIDSTGDVGADASLKVANDGTIGVCYQDLTNSDLKYASRSGNTWNIVTVDSGGNVGGGCSLAFTSTGQPAIAYRIDPDDGVKYARFDGAAWQVATVYSAQVQFAEDVSGCSLAFGPNDKAWIAFENFNGGANVMLAENAAGSWQIGSVPRPILPVVDWGFQPSLAITPDGRPVISITLDPFYPVGLGAGLPHLMFLSYDGTAWTKDAVDESPRVGYASSLVINPLGQPAISYFDRTNGRIKLAVRSPFANP